MGRWRFHSPMRHDLGGLDGGQVAGLGLGDNKAEKAGPAGRSWTGHWTGTRQTPAFKKTNQFSC